MRTRFSSFRTLLGAVLVAGGFVVACSSQSRHSDTTVAQSGPPLGQTHVSRLPSNNSAAPPDAAEAPEPPADHALPLSRGAQGLPPAQPYVPPQPNAPTSTPTNPSTPAPTPASPNAPVSTPAPNPIPPTGGGPTTDTGSTGSPAGDTPTSTQGPTNDTDAARGQSMNAFGYEPYQGGADGGVGPAPIRVPDAGAPSPLPRADGGGIGGFGGDGGLR
jgi:hypothetical protein